MRTARRTRITFWAVLALLAALSLPNYVRAASGGPEVCTVGASCVIGEFVYDDDYSPLGPSDGVTCTVESAYPNGSAFIDPPTAATGNSDGWFSYSFTTPTTTGYYPTQICCDVGTEYFCLDKSFEAKAATTSSSSPAPSADEISSAVWGYSSRTLSSLGTLVRDIWLNSTRSLTTTSTSGSEESLDSDKLNKIKKTVDENRLILEKLANEPIIENFLEDDEADLGVKIDTTKAAINIIYANNEYLRSRSMDLVRNWNGLTGEELVLNLEDMMGALGRNDDSEPQTLFGGGNWLKKAWDWESAGQILSETAGVDKTLVAVSDLVEKKGKTSIAYKDIKNLSKRFDKIDRLVGQGINSEANTLYGNLAEVVATKDALDTRLADVDAVLGDWKNKDQANRESKANEIARKLSPLNKLTSLRNYLGLVSKNSLNEKDLKNRFFGLRGVVGANLSYLARPAGETFINTWLELGSIVFKSVVTNPSSLISQKVPLKYYLPPEVKEEHILSYDEGLTVGYDAEKGQYFVSGEYTLSANESITLSVSVADIWEISPEEVESLKNQAGELSRPLEKTAFFAQGVTFKSDIDVSLDKILALQESAVTPEAKIRAFREAQIELTAVLEKISKLEELVTQAGSTGTFFGFVGGAQTMAVWGMIIVMVAGFVFLALYMKVIRGGEKTEKKVKVKKEEPKVLLPAPTKRPTHRIRNAFAFVIYGALISGTTTAVVLGATSDSKEVLGETAEAPQEVSVVMEKAQGGEDIVIIDAGVSAVKIYDRKEEGGDVVFMTTAPLEVTRIKEDGGWTNIVIKQMSDEVMPLEGWVESKYIRGYEKGEQSVTIQETPTGFLRVRNAPHGEEVDQALPGESFNYVSSREGWVEIELEDKTAWVSGEYVDIN